MKKLFPPMMECINGGYIFSIFAYWIVAFVLIPFLIPLLASGLWNNDLATAWMEIIYYAFNSVIVLLILKEHLGDASMGLHIDLKKILTTAAWALALMMLWALFTPDILTALNYSPYISWDAFPVAPMSVVQTSGFAVMNNPIFGTLCMTLLVPFSICGMFYATGFAPACCKNTWLGYVCVTIVLLLPALFDIFWRGDAEYVLITFFLRLPAHLIACWSYQKTDNVWTPIFALAGFNLLTSLMNTIIIPQLAA